MALFWVVSITLQFMPHTSAASLSSKDNTLHSVLADKVQMMQKDTQRLSINRILNIRDFSFNSYIVVECDPIGYLIYHPSSAVVIESSPTSYSPYLGLTGQDLVYCGPTEYYVKDGSKYTHTITGETITLEVDVERMELTSQRISNTLLGMKDLALLDYLSSGNPTAYATSKQANTGTRGENLSWGEINWFKALTTCGYYSYTGDPNTTDDDYGCCGYVGLAILYGFFDRFVDTKYMPDQYWTTGAKTYLKSGDDSFTKYLHDLDPQSGTTSIHIKSVSEQHLENSNITDISHTSRVWGLFTANTIKGLLDDGYPVELFGALEKPPEYNDTGKKKGHAVVAYQYTTTSETQYICHYGWPGYTEVTIVGTLGSIYAMTLEQS